MGSYSFAVFALVRSVGVAIDLSENRLLTYNQLVSDLAPPRIKNESGVALWMIYSAGVSGLWILFHVMDP